MCEYSDDTGYECQYKKLDDSDYCIFHLQDDNKDIYEFNKEIKEILDEEKDEDLINLNGFYFPSESSDFSGQIFQNKIDFHNVIFSGNANFGGTKFSKDANFSGAEFSGFTNFEKAEFSKADFSETTFSGKTSFEDAKFSGFTNFEKAEFLGYAYFKNAKFSGDVNFWITVFSEKAYFENAKFTGGANFWNADFSGDAYFGYAKFLDVPNFMKATFSGNSNFREATFSREPNVREADFSETTFSGKTSFEGATFSGEANFMKATFSGKTSFEGATFSGNANFERAELTGKFEFIPEKSETIILENTYFSDNVRIKGDMSKCSFANSNIERVDMTDSVWNVENKPKDSYKIWEERQGELTFNWKELEGIYRRLKQSSQQFGDTDAAGKFYYREMECKRKQPRGFTKWFWSVIFKVSCGYGEKPENVIIISAFIIFASSLAFFEYGIELLGSQVLDDIPPRIISYDFRINITGITWFIANFWKVIIDWIECLYTSVITFTTLGYGDVHPIGYSRIVASAEAGLGIFLTALFVFVFTRKMSR